MTERPKSLAQIIAKGHCSLREATKLIGVSYPTICKLRDANHLRTIKVGGIYKVTVDEIERFLTEGNYVAPPPTAPEGEGPTKELKTGIPAYLQNIDK